MSNAVIEAVREKIFANLDADSSPTVVWHAGEPTAAPISWYEHAYERLRDVTPPAASFAMQSNGIAIDENWIELLRRTNTSVSLSIDGPQHFHDLRRRTRNDKPTWRLAVGALRRLQDAGFEPNVICVLHPDGLTRPDAYYAFCRDHSITQISFSIDELEGANRSSSFSARDYKQDVTDFLAAILERAYAEGYPLHVREVERIATILTGSAASQNEQIEPWDTIVVAADGSVSTFSPEFTEVSAFGYRDFIFGNILEGSLQDFDATDPSEKNGARDRVRCRCLSVRLSLLRRVRRRSAGQQDEREWQTWILLKRFSVDCRFSLPQMRLPLFWRGEDCRSDAARSSAEIARI